MSGPPATGGASSTGSARPEPAIRRTESQLGSGTGDRLFRRAWIPAAPSRVMLLVHGYAEHSGRYEHMGAWFAQRGCVVHGYDHQGHGRSEGRRGHVRRFSDFLDDLDRMLEAVRSEHPGLPLFLVGHSMGGLIVATHARERRPDVTGVVTSGAALSLSEAVPWSRVAAARLLRRVMPTLSIGSGVDPEGLSTDRAVVDDYLADPFVYRTMTSSLAYELLSAVRRTGPGGAEVEAPMLLLHGEQDPICPAKGSRDFFENVPSAEKELRIYPGLRHEIFNEPQRETVFADVLRWTAERSP